MGARARRVRANTQVEPPAGPEGPTEEEEGMRTPPSRSSAAPTSNGSSLLSSKRALLRLEGQQVGATTTASARVALLEY
eukprot:4671863-Prymnesium_polylepis.1